MKKPRRKAPTLVARQDGMCWFFWCDPSWTHVRTALRAKYKRLRKVTQAERAAYLVGVHDGAWK